jgi:O-antigen/teichoic acid export membrane protein
LGRILREALGLGRALINQSLIQALMAVSGILVVRYLGTREYAFYTIAAAAITAMAALSNGGILDGMSAIGGRNPDDESHLSRLIGTALSLRNLSALILAVPIGAVSVWMLARNGAPLGTVVPLIIAVGLVNLAELHYSVLHLVPWLRRRIDELQAVELKGAIVRFLGCALIPWLIPRADVAVACAAAGIGFQIYMLRRDALVPPGYATALPEPQMKREMIDVLRRQWPNDLNALAQSQVSLWLLTSFSTVASVAAFGALGRVTIVFTVIMATLHRTMLSRYVGLTDRRRAVQVYATVISVFLALALVPFGIFMIYPEQILSLFGSEYVGLSHEFRLFAINSFLGALAMLTLWLNSTRAWIMPSGFRVLYQTGCLVVLVLWFGPTTLRGVIHAGIGVNLMLIAANVWYSAMRFRAMEPARAVPA